MRESRRGGRVNAVIWCLVITAVDKAICSICSIRSISAAAVKVELQTVRIHADRQTPLVKGKKE